MKHDKQSTWTWVEKLLGIFRATEGKLAYDGGDWMIRPPTLFKQVVSYMFFVGGVLFVVRKFSEVINRIRTCGENVSKWYSR